MSKVPFKKPPISIDDQVDTLIARGLSVPDKEKAAQYLNFIGYYHLSGYCRYFADPSDDKQEKFRNDTSFDDVLHLYIFDRKLRLLLMDAFERLEIAAKSVICHVGSMDAGAFWLYNANNFDYGSHQEIMKQVDDAIGDRGKPQHVFIKHFFDKYQNPYPASWMMFEIFSFGATSKILKVMRGNLQASVAHEFGVNKEVLVSGSARF